MPRKHMRVWSEARSLDSCFAAGLPGLVRDDGAVARDCRRFWLLVVRLQLRVRDMAAEAAATADPLPGKYGRYMRLWVRLRSGPLRR
jgi:hypothetical protein